MWRRRDVGAEPSLSIMLTAILPYWQWPVRRISLG
jgi:hypothetical protein